MSLLLSCNNVTAVIRPRKTVARVPAALIRPSPDTGKSSPYQGPVGIPVETLISLISLYYPCKLPTRSIMKILGTPELKNR